MKKYFTTPGMITVAILTVITAVFWTFFSVMRVFMTKEKDVNVPDSVISPLDPKLNKSALELISSRKFIDESQIPEIIYSESAQETPGAGATEETDETAESSPSPTPSPSPTSEPAT